MGQRQWLFVGYTDLFKYAAFNGHLEILQWLHDNGCPWNVNTCAYAALSGRLELLQ